MCVYVCDIASAMLAVCYAFTITGAAGRAYKYSRTLRGLTQCWEAEKSKRGNGKVRCHHDVALTSPILNSVAF